MKKQSAKEIRERIDFLILEIDDCQNEVEELEKELKKRGLKSYFS